MTLETHQEMERSAEEAARDIQNTCTADGMRFDDDGIPKAAVIISRHVAACTGKLHTALLAVKDLVSMHVVWSSGEPGAYVVRIEGGAFRPIMNRIHAALSDTPAQKGVW
jgi:hypothetical protein